MKKLSLLFVFVLVLVAVLAFSASAKNITKEAEFSMASGGDLCQPEYVIDDNYHTGASNGNIQKWCDYYFEFDTPKNVTRIRVICNSIGENMGVCTFDTISNYSNGVICRVKSGGSQLHDETIQTSEAITVYVDGKAVYSYIDFIPSNGTSWENVTWINIPALHEKQKETCLWEIDIFDDQECTDDTHEFVCDDCNTVLKCNACGLEKEETSHPYLAATCAVLQTCVLCGDTTGELSTEHVWKEATCQPKTCTVCGVTEGEPIQDHTWVESTCARVRHCSVCDINDENAEIIDHPDSAFVETDTDCTTAVYCSVCGAATIPSKRHTFTDDSTKCINAGCTFDGKNIASEAEISNDGNCWTIDTRYLVDGNYFVACAGSHNVDWVNYEFRFDGNRTISKLFVVINSTGNMPNIGNKDTLTQISNAINFRCWNASGTKLLDVYTSNSNNYANNPNITLYTDANGKQYVAYSYDIGYLDIDHVQVSIAGGWNNSAGFWEIEIWEHVECFYDTFVEQTLAPTCDTVGAATYRCACGNTTSKEVAALGHTWNAGEQTKAPTEDEDGIKLYTCTVGGCGGTKEGIIPALGHVHNYATFTGEIVTAPGCATPGTGMYACRCGAEQEGEVAPTGIHNYTVYQSTIVDSTYLVEGTAMYKCNACDATAEGVLPRKSYNFAKYAIEVKGSSNGWTVYPAGIIDGNYNIGSAGYFGAGSETYTITFSENYIIDKLVFVVNSVGRCPTDGTYVHNEKSENYYDFTFTIYNSNGRSLCTERYNASTSSVEMTGVDANGNEYQYDVVIVEFETPIIGRSIDIAVENSWNQIGDCILWEVETWGVSENLHTEHNFTKLIQTIKEPTCAVAGTGLYRCDSCEETAEIEIPADAAHKYTKKITNPTCTVDGYETYVCECGDSYTGATIPALGHDYDYHTEGCSRCTYEYVVHYVSSMAEFDKVYSTIGANEVIKFTADISKEDFGTTQRVIQKEIIIDLGGKTINSNGSYSSFQLLRCIAFVNGKVCHFGGQQGLKARNVDKIEKIDIEIPIVKAGTGLIILNPDSGKGGNSYIGLIKDVNIYGVGIGDHGIETYKCSNPDTNVIGTMENVVVQSKKNAFTLSATVGLIKNCTFIGSVNGLNITSLKGEVELENCTVYGGQTAVSISGVDADGGTFVLDNTALKGDNAIFNTTANIKVQQNGEKYDLSSFVAIVNNVYYTNFADALKAIATSDKKTTTVVLLADVVLTEGNIVIDKNVEFTLGGKTISYPTDTLGDGIFYVKAGTLTINGNGTVNGVGDNNYNIAIWADGGSVVINGGTYTNVGAGDDDHYDLIYVKNGGIVEINGGTFLAQTPKWTLNICDKTGGSFVVMGGTFQEGFNPGATETEPNGANNDFIPYDYYLNENGTVVACPTDEEGNIVHSFVDATCTVAGYCENCGRPNEEDPAIGHTETTIPAVPVQCLVDGATAGVKCSVCNEVLEAPVVIKAPGHVTETEATCTTPATCVNCGTVTTGAVGHKAGETTVENNQNATCTSNGSYDNVIYCTECETVLSRTTVTVNATGHNYDTMQVVKPTCTEAGYTKYTCVCGDTYNEADESKPALGHKYNYGIGACERNCDDLAIVEVTTWKELYDLVNDKDSVDFDVVKFKNGFEVKDAGAYMYVDAPIVIDLNGQTLTTSQGSAPFMLRNAGCSLVNGTIKKIGGGRQALQVKAAGAKLIADIKIEITPTDLSLDITGFLIYGKVEKIESLTITGAHKNGIEITDGAVVSEMKDVSVEAVLQAINLTNGAITKATECTFKSGAIGILASNLKGNMALEKCVIDAGSIALVVKNVYNNADFSFDSATSITTKGAIYDIGNNKIESLQNVVALVNGRLYSDLDAAIAALEASTKEVTDFTLMNDLEITESIVINKKVNFSLGGATYRIPKYNSSEFEPDVTIPGYTITINTDDNDKSNGVFHVVEGGVLTLSGDGTVDATNASDYSMAIWADGGEVIINAGTYTNVGAGEDDQYDLIYAKNGGKVTINGGSFKSQTPKWTLNVKDNDGSTIVVNGGSFYMYNPTESASENPVVDFTSGKCAVKNSENYYVVTEHTVATLEAKAPTCVATGLTAGSHCSVCGTVFVAQETVDALGHNFVAGEMAENGDVVYSCSRECGVATYTINNSAINGEYYLGTDLVVFNNGVLSAMGGEFTYTYNVTTGMITTDDEGLFFQMIEGTVFYRGRQPLHTHAVENLIKEVTDPTCTAKGYTTYICRVCGPLYTGNEVAAKGHRFNSQVTIPATCTEDAVLVISCGDCNAEFRSPSKETDAYIESLKPFVTIVLEKAGHKWTDATCITPKTCSVCNATEGEALGHTPGKAVVEKEVPATPTTAGSYDKVVYCSVCNTELSRETVTVEPTCKHTNKETIPAENGMITGVMCSDCKTILVASEAADSTYKFRAISLTLSENIDLVYKVFIPEGYESPYIVFEMNGNKFEITEYTTEWATLSDGTKELRHCFVFPGVRLQYMADNISATLYSTVGEQQAVKIYANYSVKTYIVNQLNKANTAEFKTMISDLLLLGDAAQIYAKYKTDNLMSADVDKSILTPSTYSGIPQSEYVQNLVGTSSTIAGFKAVSLLVENNMTVQYKLSIQKSELDNIKIKVTIPIKGQESRIEYYNANELDYDEVNDRYILQVPNVKVSQYGQKITAEIYHNETQIGKIFEYSVNTYLQKNQDNSNVELRDFLRALYQYGKSAYEYAY